MPVDNRHFIVEDLPDDPEDDISPDDEDDDDEEEVVSKPQPSYQQPPPSPRPTYQPQAPWQQTTVFPPRPQAPWLGTSPFTRQQYQTQPQQQGYAQTRQTLIPRRKKVIFCDLIDILIESESAVREQQQGYLTGNNNYKRYGVMPRGLYDIRLKTEVWGKLAAFGADYVFCLTNQSEKSEEELKTWKVMTDYVMYSLADYLSLPHQNCLCLTKIGYDRFSEDTKPDIGMLKKALQLLPKNFKYSKKNLVVVGINSGYQNQSDTDKRMASKAGIDYIDVNDLLLTYY